MTQKEAAYQKIAELVHRFSEQFASYKNVEYNETLTRRDFIDPFFKALGWDIDNQQGYAEAYREVIHEDKIKVGSATKVPDYSFRIGGGKRLFFVEAKKPSVDIKEGVQAAYQVRRYGWSAKLSISVITDFEEFAIYDCTKKPKPDDKAAVARIRYITFKDYLKEFDFLWETFSKEQVLKGSFDKFLAGAANKKGTTTVDKDFLESLDKWRTLLASNISRNNQQLDEDELNFAVQQTINRIIFLRIAEDRGIEPYGNMQKALHDTNFYKNLFDSFKTADDKYNSGLFDFKKDRICSTLIIDNKIIKTIVNELYYPLSPYEFSVLSVEILGSAYEQFLGKVIRVTPAHFVKVEEKPEVRKAGGVYYTPQYIVDYIVQNTVGKLTEGKTPVQVSDLKICDPACGSGSFLIGAYQYLLDWHKNYYTNNGKSTKTNKDNTLTPDGNLTATEKKRILLNNIYGVDIDANAVEVTKLSLLLKCLEGETEASIKNQLSMFHERVLPTLDSNIRDGNSLIGEGFYGLQFEFGEERKIKPFDWEKAFPGIFKDEKALPNMELKRHFNKVKQFAEQTDLLINKLRNQAEEPLSNYGINIGFDIVIGNPPYRMMQPKDTDKRILDYFKKSYNIAEFKIDLFHLFFQKGLLLLKENGLLGYIAPSSLLNNVYAENLRQWILNNALLNSIALTKEKVFPDADVYTAVYILERNTHEKNIAFHYVKTTTELELAKANNVIEYSLTNQKRFSSFEGNVWNILVNESNVNIIEKIKSNTIKLSEISKINRGLITGNRQKYFSNVPLNDKYKPILTGSDVQKYGINPVSEFVLFERPKTSGGCWDASVHFAKNKIIIRQIGFAPTATIIQEPIAVTGNIFTIRSKSLEFEKYLLAIINSKMIEFFWKIMFADFKNSFPQVSVFSLNSIPIIDNPNSMVLNEIILFVDQLLQLNLQKQQTKLASSLNQIQSKIDYCESRINKIIYELYGLTEEDVKIVEGK